MKKNPFDAYKLPLGLTEGVDIPLPGTPAVFRVVLPGTMNEDFNMDLLGQLSTQPDENGEIRVDTVKFQRVRKSMFFGRCILSATGLPDDMDAETFFATYPLAARSIYEKAPELAIIADKEADEALGKFETTPRSNYSGEVEKANTIN